MAMSANETRALEQVKMGLAILYGAGRLTEDVWIKIDGLIHNGQYVFTPGPPNHILDEPLMNFEESKHEAKDEVNVQDAVVHPFNTSEKDIVVVSEKQIPSPANSEPTHSPAETPSRPFEETSPHERNTLLKPTRETPMFDSSNTTVFSVNEPAGLHHHPEQAQPSSNNNASESGRLPAGYAYKQFDEVERSNADLVKEGQKSRPIYTSVEESERETKLPEPVKASDRQIWMHSSVSEVGVEDHASLPHSQSWNQPYPSLPAGEFIKLKDKSKTIEDFYVTRAPNTAARTTKSPANTSSTHVANSGSNGAGLQFEVTPGTILIAQSSFTKNAKVHIEVCQGDMIRVMKPVSGIMYVGENLRTKQRGQFPNLIFKQAPGTQKEYFSTDKQKTTAKSALVRNASSSSSSIHNELDKVEGMNAAEWDKDDASVATAAVRSIQDFLERRNSVLGNVESQSQHSEPSQQNVLQEMMSKMLDEKLQKILKVEGATAGSNKDVPTYNSENHTAWKDPLKSVAPKSQTCWYWATPNKECRFTDDECRDLHAFQSTKFGEPLNLRMGKPTWGALADASFLSSNEAIADPKGRKKTCWYWANAKCNYSAEECKYLHEHASAGVMPRPWDKSSRWSSHTRMAEDGMENEKDDREGEFVLTEVKNGLDSRWREGSSGWIEEGYLPTELGETSSQRYKPPHVKALEEKARLESVGWW